MEKEKELRLIKGAQAGDREALTLLWDAITPKLFGYLVNTTRNKTLAEDILQTTWLKAINGLPSYTWRGVGIQAWLFAIARNECRMHWRKSGKETALETLEYDPKIETEEKIREKIWVDQVLSYLSADDQEILRLRFIADLPLNEIAKILNLNFVNVRVRIHRALGRARKYINSQKI